MAFEANPVGPVGEQRQVVAHEAPLRPNEQRLVPGSVLTGAAQKRAKPRVKTEDSSSVHHDMAGGIATFVAALALYLVNKVLPYWSGITKDYPFLDPTQTTAAAIGLVLIILGYRKKR